MKKLKFVLKDEEGRVQEIVDIASIDEHKKKYHPDLIAMGDVTEKAVKCGQVYDKSKKKYVNCAAPSETSEEKVIRLKHKALVDIEKLRRDALDVLIETSTNPDIIAIRNKIEKLKE